MEENQGNEGKQKDTNQTKKKIAPLLPQCQWRKLMGNGMDFSLPLPA
jgi:hypothetical protein